VLFYAAREDSCVSNERLHKENVYVPLNEGRHKDLPQKPRYDIHGNKNVAVQKRIHDGTHGASTASTVEKW